MTTIKDIAKLSGYSIGTVSRVINAHPDVSEEARKRIEQVIAETGYQPNSNAKLLKQRTTSSITVIVKGRMNVFFSEIVEHVQNILSESGEEAIVVYIDDFDNEVLEAERICAERKPKGIIFLGGNRDYFRRDFERIEVPCVLLTNNAEDLHFENLSSFSTDDAEGSKEAVEYLIRAGHKRIGIIGGSGSEGGEGHIDYDRLQGCEEVFMKHSIAFDRSTQYVASRFSMEDGYAAAKDILSMTPDLTALFCMSDIIALGALRAAADMGRNVPGDLSIIGYDGIPYAFYSVPRLATIQQDAETIARKGVEDLLIRLNYTRPAHHETIPFRVLAGETVKPPKT